MTLHQFPHIEQGSQDWHDLRRGIVTASTVGKLVSVRNVTAAEVNCPTCTALATQPCTGKRDGAPIKTMHPERAAAARLTEPVLSAAPTDDSRALTWALIAERITGITEDTYVSHDMMRGVMCEPIARDVYSRLRAPAVEMGFMRRDEDGWQLGWSPDGLVGDNGAIEIKAPRAKTHIRTILSDEVPAQYVPQCQAALLVSGRDWLDFVSFHGGLPLFVKRVFPDPAWHAAIEAACRQFEQTVTETVADYTDRVAGLPPTERIDYDMEIVI